MDGVHKVNGSEMDKCWIALAMHAIRPMRILNTNLPNYCDTKLVVTNVSLAIGDGRTILPASVTKDVELKMASFQIFWGPAFHMNAAGRPHDLMNL